MRKIIGIVDSISRYTGKIVSSFCVFLVLVLVYEVTLRHVFDAPTNWALETSVMLGCSIIALGWAYVYWQNAHIRVDVFYAHLSSRGKTIINVVGTLLFLFPLVIALGYAATTWMWSAWEANEKLAQSNWLPPAGPIRTVMLLGVFLLFLQAGVQFFRDLHMLTRNKPYD